MGGDRSLVTQAVHTPHLRLLTDITHCWLMGREQMAYGKHGSRRNQLGCNLISILSHCLVSMCGFFFNENDLLSCILK